MMFGSRRFILGALCSTAACVLVVGLANGQAGQPTQAARQPMAEQVFKKVDILKGIPVDEFMDTMGMFSAALSLNCIDCHVPESVGGWERSEEHTSELQSLRHLVCRLLLEKKKKSIHQNRRDLRDCKLCNLRPKRKKILIREGYESTDMVIVDTAQEEEDEQVARAHSVCDY